MSSGLHAETPVLYARASPAGQALGETLPGVGTTAARSTNWPGPCTTSAISSWQNHLELAMPAISGLLAWRLENLRGVPGQIQGRNELLLSKQLMCFHAFEGASLGHRGN